MKTMTPFTRKVIDNGITGYSCIIEQVGCIGLMLTTENDFEFLTELKLRFFIVCCTPSLRVVHLHQKGFGHPTGHCYMYIHSVSPDR